MHEKPLRGALNRLLQGLARIASGGHTLRVWLHRSRGVRIGEGCFIGADVMIETSFPSLVELGDRVIVGLRSTIVAHFDGDIVAKGVPDAPTVRIGSNAFIGPGAIIMPNVTVGEGSVVAAGSVVTRSVPPHHLVQGNPARTVGTCERPLTATTSTWAFIRGVSRVPQADGGEES